ncbi:MAG: YtxH domain-containing protein [Chitinophagaceae bacterium]|nr:MAG: YtxH domain-containing protein [Chitinophagaceae bacterium]
MNKIIIAFTSGIILGLLYAPAKGSNTRRKIANLGNDLKDRWNDVTDSVANRIDSIREGVDDLADRAVEKVESAQFTTPPRPF